MIMYVQSKMKKVIGIIHPKHDSKYTMKPTIKQYHYVLIYTYLVVHLAKFCMHI